MRKLVRIFKNLLVLLAFLAFSGLFLLKEKSVGTVVFDGPFRAVDGDTLTFGREKLRLKGLDAPERRQQCGSGKGVWKCGERARLELQARLKSGAVCTAYGRDKYRRLLATCSVSGQDIGASLVREGFALGYGAYVGEEREAETARRGLWSGPFETPSDWRKAHRHLSTEPETESWLNRFWQW